MIKKALSVILIILSIELIGCFSSTVEDESKIIGTWIFNPTAAGESFSVGVVVYNFFSNKSYSIMTYDPIAPSIETVQSGTYSIDSKTISLFYDNGRYDSGYYFSNDYKKLTLINNNIFLTKYDGPLPLIEFTESGNGIKIASISSLNIPWSDIEIDGCDTSNLKGYIKPGDDIKNCLGNTITIKYKPLNVLLYQSSGMTPEIMFSKDDVNNKLTVVSVNPGNLKWRYFEISGEGFDRITLYTSDNSYYSLDNGNTWNPSNPFADDTSIDIKVGDYFLLETSSGQTGVITIRYKPTNTLRGTWSFK